MIRIYSYSRESNRMETPSIADLPRHLSDRGRTIWVDLENPTDEETGVLGGMFGFHILTVEDCMGDATLPKEDVYDGYTYSVFYAAAPTSLDRLAAQKLDIFVGPNFLVTNHAEEIKGLFDTRGVVAKNPGSLLRSSDWLLHGILNTVIDFCKPALEGMEARVDRIADAVADGSAGLEDAIDLNQDLRQFRDVTANQQGALERLGYSSETYVSEENRDYFRDVHDHNRHLHHRAVQGLEKLAWALDAVRVADSRRTQNAVRWGVAIATAVLLPLLVVTALSMPSKVFTLSDQVPTVVVGAAVAYVIGVLVLLKQKRWF